MEPRPTTAADELDVHELFFRLSRRWPWLLASVLLAGLLAFVYVRVQAPVYAFRATMLLGDQGTGSKRAQELLKILEVKEGKGIKIEDEVGLLTSADMVQRALARLPFNVTYYVAPNTWLNSLKDVQVREQTADVMPFRLRPLPNAAQLTGVRLYVEVLPDNRLRVQTTAPEGEVRDLATGELVRTVPDVHLNETVRAGDTLRTPLLTAVLERNPAYPAASPSSGRYFCVLRDLADLTSEFQNALVVRPIDHESRIVELTSKGSVPQKQQQFLDMLMRVYVEDDLQVKNQTGQKTVAFLDREIGHMADSLRRSASALSSFRSARGVVDVAAQSSAGIQQQNELEMMRAKIATNRKYYQNMLAYLRANTGASLVAPSSVGIEDPAVNNLILQLNDLNNQRAALGVNASSENPIVTILDQRIRTAKESLTQTLTNMTRAADISLHDLNAQLGRVRGTMSRLPENERQLASLKNKTDFNDKNYQFLIEKRAEAAIALATNATDKKVVDAAEMVGNKPVSPKPALAGLVALLLGLGLPLGVLLVADKANRRIQGKEDLSRVTTIPLLGVVAHGSRQDKQQMLQNPKGPLAESFRSIRVNLQYLAAGLDKKVIGITSSVPGEGKTFCAVNLAAEMAQSGRRVLLLECDLRRPTIASYFTLGPKSQEHGLSSYLMGLSTLDECVQTTNVRGLDVLCCGPVPTNPTELLESTRMTNLLAELRETYDYVIIDTPPTGYVAEFFMLLRHLDANIYVVRQNYTDRSLLSQINELHQEQKVKQVYMLINDVRFSKSYEYRYKKKAYAYGY